MDKPTPAPSQEPLTLGTYNGFEVYPMPILATLVVDDPQALATWYEQALGFHVMFAGPVIHLRRRKYQDLLVVGTGPGRTATRGGPILSFDAEGEVDELAARAMAIVPSGTSKVDPVVDTPWNLRELRVTDPAGHHLAFRARPANPDPVLTTTWNRAFDAGRTRE